MKILLCLYDTPRPAMPALQGRSGTVYGRAYYNEKAHRHECGPFDVTEYSAKILPDIQKFRSITAQRWMMDVAFEAGEVNVAELQNELDKAKAKIAELEARLAGATNTVESKPEPPPVETSPKTLADMSVRELRALVKERGLPLPSAATKDDLIASLEGAVMT